MPTSVRFNTCFEGDRPRSMDSEYRDPYYAYALTVHEGGHALGLSDWSLGAVAEDVARGALNSIVDTINFIARLVGQDVVIIPKIPDGVGELTTGAVYRASHPSTIDSVMNYDRMTGVNEPDCSPYPLDVMAIDALYQSP